ncbi:exodeoxyribonuclease III [Cuniculiplasma divulgatum]|uniref:Exodeoxyribonuclease III n=1 Tax=Cuniculiplasma divulgatum TaxID=1673428 RepID=A0A1N5VKZ5_9ARCH|nr:exodeoxyribonuclease III [Cuniculiplasma divulgatum]SIM73428.1 exodeoxyribonuclease III [Cuniculiplasma divulgatum]
MEIDCMTAKLYSWNVNGLRASMDHGLMDFIESVKPDVLCMQETKIMGNSLPVELLSAGYKLYINEAEKKGYSGTVTLTKVEPLNVMKGMGNEVYDKEGRILTLEFKDFFLVNSYFPNSRRNLERLQYKLDFNTEFQRWIKNLEKRKPVIICGDFNVAHSEIDIARPKENQKNAGFTIEERTWMDNFLDDGFIDSFRAIHQTDVKYSWWSYMGRAREKNIGWRIDYFILSAALKEKIISADIMDNVKGSDHAPVYLLMNSEL